MSSGSLPEITGKICELLEPLSSEERNRVLSAAAALLGESQALPMPHLVATPEGDAGTLSVGPSARRWIAQNQITETALHEIFFIENGHVEIISNGVPGRSKRMRTQNCYLLCGVRALLATDQPSFGDAEALELCKNVGAFDSPNHASNRKDLGNKLRGSKETGFFLSIPGLRAAADLVKEMIG